MSTNEIFLNIQYYPSLEENIFENFNISENNIISVKLAKVLWYCSLLLIRPTEEELKHIESFNKIKTIKQKKLG
jgi:hypothetical protein